MIATTEPTPLYALWERSYGFGAIVTTLVVATYAVGVIAALLFAGRDSDVDGRRPVLAACAGLSALSSILFLNTATNQYVSWEMNDTTVAAVHTLGAPGAGWSFLGLS